MKIRSSIFIKGIRGTDPIVTDGKMQVAFVGRSNVGKSSLINALCNKTDLVKVSRKPGKTTEINFFFINEEFYFVDLPGYGYAKVSPQEKEKIQKLIIWYVTKSGAKPSKVALIIDIKVGLTEFDHQMIEILQEHNHPFVVVANKADKLTQKELAERLSVLGAGSDEVEIVPSSAEKRGGIALLLKKLF